MTKLESLKAAPERVKCEAIRVRPKLPWRPQEFRDARKHHVNTEMGLSPQRELQIVYSRVKYKLPWPRSTGSGHPVTISTVLRIR